MEIVLPFIVFERETNEVFGRCGLSKLLNFSESKDFAGEALVLGDISPVFGMDIGYLF